LLLIPQAAENVNVLAQPVTFSDDLALRRFAKICEEKICEDTHRNFAYIKKLGLHFDVIMAVLLIVLKINRSDPIDLGDPIDYKDAL
jgi:hypothetical protein